MKRNMFLAWLRASAIHLFVIVILVLANATTAMAQVKKDQIRYTSVVRAKDDWTENSFSVDATKRNGTNEQVTFTGKVYSYYNPTTQKKDLYFQNILHNKIDYPY